MAQPVDDSAISRFESAWLDGKPIPIESCLTREDSRYLATLQELVEIELEFRWRASVDDSSDGQTVVQLTKVEDYLARFPVLHEPERLFQLLRQEYLVRHKFGDQPDVAEYLQRFPDMDLQANDFQTPDRARRSASVERSEGTRLGRYVLVDRHGEGAFGRVWAADDPKLGRRIAIKELSERATADPEFRQRFVTEARITSQLEHPGVVPVYELEELTGDQPYYTMKLVGGRTLDEAIDQYHKLSLKDSGYSLEQAKLLGSYLSVCRTMEYAHAQGIVHRDLKPANVILGDYGETIVLDWGLAKQLKSVADESAVNRDNPTSTDPLKTSDGALMGTPAYMSPEQAEGDISEIDYLSDIYALGVFLYRLLTARLPHEGNSLHEVLRQVRDGIPVRLRVIVPSVPRPLEAICEKAMAKRREDRYQSAAELRADVERYLADEPVSAWTEPVSIRLGRWAKRNRTLVSAVSVGIVIATVFFGVGTVLFRSLYTSERNARTLANRKTIEATEHLAESERQAGIANRRLTQIRRSLYASQLVRVAEIASSDPAQGLAMLNDIERCPADLREFTWHLLNRISQRAQLAVPVDKSEIRCLAHSPETKLLVSGHSDGKVRLWTLPNQKPVGTLMTRETAVNSVAINPDGTHIAAGYDDGETILWNVKETRLIKQWSENEGAVNSVAFSPDGTRLAAAGTDQTIRLWNTSTGKIEKRLVGHEGSIFSVAFHPVEEMIASAGKDPVIRVWDVMNSQLLSEIAGHLGWVTTVAFSHDGEQLVSGSIDGSIKIWDWKKALNTSTLRGHTEPVSVVAFFPDDQRLLSASYDRMISLWNIAQRDRILLKGHTQPVTSAVVREDQSIVSGSLDKQLQVWDGRRLSDQSVTVHHSRPVSAIALSPDGETAASASYRGDVSLWYTRTGKPIAELPQHSIWVSCSAFDPVGRWLATGDGAGTVRLWDIERRRDVWIREAGPLTVACLAFSPDGRFLVVSIEDANECIVLDAVQGHVLRRMTPSTDPIIALKFDAKGHGLIVGTLDAISVLNVESGEQIARFETPNLNHLAVPSRGSLMVVSDRTGATIRNLRTGQVVATLTEQANPPLCVALSHDGQTIATGSADHRVRLWDAVTGQLRASLKVHSARVTALSFGPGDRFLMTGSDDHTAKIWWTGL